MSQECDNSKHNTLFFRQLNTVSIDKKIAITGSGSSGFPNTFKNYIFIHSENNVRGVRSCKTTTMPAVHFNWCSEGLVKQGHH